MAEDRFFRDALARAWAAGLPDGALLGLGEGRRVAVDPADIVALLDEEQALGLLCTLRAALWASLLAAISEPGRARLLGDRLACLLEHIDQPAISAVGTDGVTHIDIDITPNTGDGGVSRFRVPAREFKGEPIKADLDGAGEQHRVRGVERDALRDAAIAALCPVVSMDAVRHAGSGGAQEGKEGGNSPIGGAIDIGVIKFCEAQGFLRDYRRVEQAGEGVDIDAAPFGQLFQGKNQANIDDESGGGAKLDIVLHDLPSLEAQTRPAPDHASTADGPAQDETGRASRADAP
jgi:hypothetical protein